MQLTDSTTCEPATDLGYLLHKNPDRPHRLSRSFDRAQMSYREANDARGRVAPLDVDPAAQVRQSRRGDGGFALEQHVTDAPPVASSLLSVARAHELGSALNDQPRERGALAEAALRAAARLSRVPGMAAFIGETQG